MGGSRDVAFYLLWKTQSFSGTASEWSEWIKRKNNMLPIPVVIYKGMLKLDSHFFIVNVGCLKKY